VLVDRKENAVEVALVDRPDQLFGAVEGDELVGGIAEQRRDQRQHDRYDDPEICRFFHAHRVPVRAGLPFQ